VRLVGVLIEEMIIVDNSIHSGMKCRTVSGWKHSSTKATFMGIMFLGSRLLFWIQ